MGMITLKCCNCGDNMHADDSRQKVFCSSCGAENIITQDIINVNNTYNQTTNIGTQNVTQNVTAKLGKDTDELINDGETFLKLGDYTRAFEAFDKATKLKPSDYRGWLGMAEADKLSNALEHSRNARKLAPPEMLPEVKKRIARILFVVSNYDEGRLDKYLGHDEGEEIVIPDFVKKIPDLCCATSSDDSYVWWKAKSVYIPDSVEFVGEWAFSGWEKHQTIYVNKNNSKKWRKKWDKGCKAKIVYR